MTKEEEDILIESIKYLQEEYNIKLEKLKLLRQELSQTKKLFKSKISDYQKDIKLIIEKENETEKFYSKIAKNKKRRSIILKCSFNNKFYEHLLEISSNDKKEKILKKYFSLIIFENNNEKRTTKELIEILKDKDEIKNLLLYTYKIYYNLKNKDEESYNNLKEKCDNFFSELQELDNPYPFDEMFECLRIIFDIIEYETLIKDNNFALNKLTEKKNAKFVEIKFIELKIKNYTKIIKKIRNHLKIMHNFYNNFKDNNNTNNNEINYRELIDNIEEFKKIDVDINKMNSNYDAISSLTFGTYYTQSEESSMKSNTLCSINGIKLLNNNKINNINNNDISPKLVLKDKKRDINNNILKGDKTEIIKESINCIYMKEDHNIEENKENEEQNEIKNINDVEDNLINEDNNNDYSYENKIKNDENIIKDINLNNINNIIYDSNNYEREKENQNNTRIKNNLANLQKFGLKISEIKEKKLSESFEMNITKENMNNYSYINQEYNNNNSSVCDEMINYNFETNNNIRTTTNDFINKIGVKNNLILSQEIFKDKIFSRKKNNHELKIEKSVDSPNCCISCT